MDRLWAPWRDGYIRNNKKDKGCIFCKAQKDPSAKQVIFRSKQSICLLNIYPYNNGHLLISPLRHFGDISEASEEELLDIFGSLKRAKKLLEKTLKPHGFNLGFNLGRAAGAGIIDHLHLHLVPRWAGDVNFMPVLGNSKVISQSLKELAKILKKADHE